MGRLSHQVKGESRNYLSSGVPVSTGRKTSFRMVFRLNRRILLATGRKVQKDEASGSELLVAAPLRVGARLQSHIAVVGTLPFRRLRAPEIDHAGLVVRVALESFPKDNHRFATEVDATRTIRPAIGCGLSAIRHLSALGGVY